MLRRFAKAVGVFGYVIQYGCWTHCVCEYICDFVIVSRVEMIVYCFANDGDLL